MANNVADLSASVQTEVARSLGLHVDEGAVKAGFKIGQPQPARESDGVATGRSSSSVAAYKQWAASHPLYGKLTDPPLNPTLWWQNVIRDTFLHAGVPPSRL